MALTYPLNRVVVPLELMAPLVSVHVLWNCLVSALLLIRPLLVMTVDVVPSNVAACDGTLPLVKKLANVVVPILGLLFPSRLMETPVRLRLMAGLKLALAIPLL